MISKYIDRRPIIDRVFPPLVDLTRSYFRLFRLVEIIETQPDLLSQSSDDLDGSNILSGWHKKRALDVEWVG